MRFSNNYLQTRAAKLAGLILVAAALDVAAGVGLSYVAGFSEVRRTLAGFQPIWLIAVVGGLVVSFLGYYHAYQQVYLADRGPDLSPGQLWAVTVAGFGGYLASGESALDQYALESAGADTREARIRVGVLGGLEYGVLGLIGCVVGIIALATGRPTPPPLSFQLPWAVLPVPGFLLAFWLVGHYGDRFRQRTGFMARVGVLTDTVAAIRHMFTSPRRHGSGPLGMAVFWLAEFFAGWAALAAFGFRMNGASFVLGYATGVAFTRRVGPFAGAGILMLCLPVTIWYSGAPFAAAIAAIFVLRFMSLWLPLPFALASLPTLRAIGRRPTRSAKGSNRTGEGSAPEKRRASATGRCRNTRAGGTDHPAGRVCPMEVRT